MRMPLPCDVPALASRLWWESLLGLEACKSLFAACRNDTIATAIGSLFLLLFINLTGGQGCS